MSAYLIDNPPRRDQYRNPRRQSPSGVVVVHTAENVLDEFGADGGAEAVAAFIRTRTTPGSYHDLADSDSNIHVLPYEFEAYQDGTGSNPHALSLSFACRANDWRTMDAERRDNFLRNGARAFARQHAWLTSQGVEPQLRWLTRPQSAAGMPGFVDHGTRDPERRYDPGSAFDRPRFLEFCAEAIAAPPPPPTPSPLHPVIGRGDTGPVVELVQKRLINHGHGVEVDGDFGPATEAAVKRHQRAWRLQADGVVGPATWPTLLAKGPKGT